MRKLFRMPEVFGIRPALIQSPEEPEKTVRVETCTTEFIDNHVPSGLQFFPEGRVVVFDKFPEPFSLVQADRGPEC